MKNVLTLFAAALLIISSCKDKEKEGSTPTVTGISLKKTSLTMEEKETFKLEAIITPEEADKSIEWDSNNKNAATVAADGVVTAVKAGKATITAKSKSNTSLKPAECLITVVAKKVPATAITINPATASVLVNETRTLIAIMTPTNATDIVEWKSSDEKTATVSPDGLVKGLLAGTVTITATSTKNPSIKGECKLTVTTTPVAITGLKLTPDKVTLAVDGTQQLVITIEPKEATENVTFSSSAENTASVSNAGLIRANSGGTAVITAANKDGKITATCAVTVTIPVASITLGPDKAKVAIGEAGALTLTVDVKPDNASNKALTWKSSKQEVATVAQEGDKVKVTGLSVGTTTITATATDGSTAADGTAVTGELLVTVQNNLAVLSAIELGVEKFKVTPAAEGTTVVNHAPRTIFANYTNLTKVPVTLTASSNATVTKGDTGFNGGEVDFSNGATVTFTVKAEDGVATKSYTVAITAYHKNDNPYGVYTAAHLNDVRNDMTKDASYKMMNNITLPNLNAEGAAATTGIDDYATAGWLPIAHDPAFSVSIVTGGGFTGIFDGGGFSVDNIYINRSTHFIGLFGAAQKATIQNLGVSGTVIYAAVASSGTKHVGALAAYIEQGSITNCYASASVSMTGTIQGQCYLGGLLGISSGAATSKSYSSGNVSGNATGDGLLYMGGFAGSVSNGTLSDCFATGNGTASVPNIYEGGFVGGFFPNTATNCYATGKVEVTVEGGAVSLGALGGLISASDAYINCYRNSGAAITNKGNAVTPVDANKKGITAKIEADMKSAAFATSLGTAWGYNADKNGGFPYIK